MAGASTPASVENSSSMALMARCTSICNLSVHTSLNIFHLLVLEVASNDPAFQRALTDRLGSSTNLVNDTSL